MTIDRDEWGVPHIFAAKEEGGYFGLGYAMSEDRFERLMQIVLFERGELASVAGPSAVEKDVQNRLWRNREMAGADLGQLSPQVRRDYLAFAAGVRAYVDKAAPKPELAALARSITLTDLVAIPRAVVYAGYHEQYAQAECRVDGMTYSPGMLPYRSSENAPASNGWVVMPARTADGALILAADPHVDTQNVAYYEYEIDAGGLHSAGFAMGPALWQAHTETVAWAMTTGNPDFLDCYEIQTDPIDPRRYLYDGKPRRMEVRNETIKVAGAPDVTRQFEYALINGMPAPIVARRGDKAYAASAADMDRAGYLNEEFHSMNTARSVGGLRRALATMSAMPQNITAGDSAGHVLFIRVGRTPVRPKGYDWTRPVPGNTSKTAWLGFRSIDEMVQLRDPHAGFLQNDNAAPDGDDRARQPARQQLSAGRLLRRAGTANAARRAHLQVLAANPHVTLGEAMDLAFDEMWITAPGWIEALRYAVATRPDLVAAETPATRAAARAACSLSMGRPMPSRGPPRTSISGARRPTTRSPGCGTGRSLTGPGKPTPSTVSSPPPC